jgi:hypothetical protein
VTATKQLFTKPASVESNAKSESLALSDQEMRELVRRERLTSYDVAIVDVMEYLYDCIELRVSEEQTEEFEEVYDTCINDSDKKQEEVSRRLATDIQETYLLLNRVQEDKARQGLATNTDMLSSTNVDSLKIYDKYIVSLLDKMCMCVELAQYHIS